MQGMLCLLKQTFSFGSLNLQVTCFFFSFSFCQMHSESLHFCVFCPDPTPSLSFSLAWITAWASWSCPGSHSCCTKSDIWVQQPASGDADQSFWLSCLTPAQIPCLLALQLELSPKCTAMTYVSSDRVSTCTSSFLPLSCLSQRPCVSRPWPCPCVLSPGA